MSQHLEPGMMVDSYRILSLLGKGGMGEVFLAKDTRLDRKVALKIVPTNLAHDPDRLRRFTQEARAASALNHPNILTIYEVGEAESGAYIAAEFIQGETLRERMNAIRLTAREALDVAIQAAGALAAAHQAGIVHRDIKPENIMIRADGYIKILDFGLAKLTDPSDGPAESAMTMTSPGIVMGTAQYMSPEQARGLSLDARSDLFSLGIVVYEMLAHRPPFEGDTPSHVIVAILDRTPQPITLAAPDAPAQLQPVLEKALAKRREDRYQTAKGFAADLESVRRRLDLDTELRRVTPPDGSPSAITTGAHAPAGSLKPGPNTAAPPVYSGSDTDARPLSPRDLETESERRRRGERAVPKRRRLAWVAAVTIVGISASTYALFTFGPGRRQAAPGREVPPLRVVPLTTLPGPSAFPAFSPDGQKVAFSWLPRSRPEKQRRQNIYVKPVGNGDPVRLTESDSSADRMPQWSPDGNWIAFQRTTGTALMNALMIVPAEGGPAKQIADMGIGLAWSPDGKEIAYAAPYAPFGSGGIVIRSVATGNVRELTHPKPYADGTVAWSPDGKTIAFLRSLTESAHDVFVVSSAGGNPKRLTFDEQIIEGLAWTPDSRDIVFVSFRFGGPKIWRVPAAGGTPELVDSTAHHPAYPAISRRGNRLAFSEAYDDSNIWRYERAKPRDGGKPLPFTSPKCLLCSTLEDDSPKFSPDGRKIVFVSKRTGNEEIWVAGSDGSSPVQLTSLRATSTGSPRWSPDGTSIAFDSRIKGNPDIFVIGAQGGSPRQLTPDISAEVEPSWSRDGRWVYFASNRGGQYQIWKAPFEGGAARQVTEGSGLDPMESPDGERVYYFRPDADGIWTVPVDGGREEQIPELRRLKRTRAWTVRDDGIFFFEDGPAGRRFVQFFSFAERRVTTLLQPGIAPVRSVPGLDLSPDGRILLWTQTDQIIEGLFMIENFR